MKKKTVIVSDDGAVVVIDEKEWQRTKETLSLLADQRSLTALLRSHEIRDSGKQPEGRSIEDVFADVSDSDSQER